MRLLKYLMPLSNNVLGSRFNRSLVTFWCVNVVYPQRNLFHGLEVARILYGPVPDVSKCQLRDSNCLKSSAQAVVPVFIAGIQEVGSEVLDPLHVDEINVDLAGLKLNVRDADITGLKKAVIDKLSIDMGKKRIQLVFHADLVLKGLYKASGRLLILPISGDGQTVMKLKNCVLSMDIPFDIVKNNDGKDIINPKSFTFKYDVKDNAHYSLSNLFNGNKAASDTMHTFMNTSWKLLTEEFGIPMFTTPMNKVYKSIKAYLSSQPMEELVSI